MTTAATDMMANVRKQNHSK